MFDATLRALRSTAGHSSARAFFRACGGQRRLGCTYKAYLNIEAGRSLPQPALAWRIAQALSLPQDADGARAFSVAYLRSAVGGAELGPFLLNAVCAPHGGGRPDALFERASEEGFSRLARPMTREEAELLYRDVPAYWCFAVLSNDSGRWAPPNVGVIVGVSAARARAALDRLVKVGLAAKDKHDRYYCPDIGKVFQYPRDKFFRPRALERLKAHWSAMAARRGKTLLLHRVAVRAEEDDLRAVLPRLAQSVYAAHVYTRREPGDDTAVFTVETRARRLPEDA